MFLSIDFRLQITFKLGEKMDITYARQMALRKIIEEHKAACTKGNCGDCDCDCFVDDYCINDHGVCE